MDSFWNENISSNHSAVSMNDSHSSVSDVSVSLDTDLDSDLEDSDEENDLSDLDVIKFIFYTGCGKLAAAFVLAITFFIFNENR